MPMIFINEKLTTEVLPIKLFTKQNNFLLSIIKLNNTYGLTLVYPGFYTDLTNTLDLSLVCR